MPDFYQPQAYQDQAYQDQAYQAQAYQDQAHQGRAHQQHDQAYQEQAYQEPHQPPDPARYDDALYGRLEGGEQDYQRDPAYPDDPYAFQATIPRPSPTSREERGGMITVAAIPGAGRGRHWCVPSPIAHLFGSPRSGEPPIIKADNSPTKIVPAPTDTSAKVPDRMAFGDGTEKIVPREEAPVDVKAKARGPRVVFPPLNQNANPPSLGQRRAAASRRRAANAANGTLPNNEPRSIRTLSVNGDQPMAAPRRSAAAKPAPPPPARRSRARRTARAAQPPSRPMPAPTQPLSLAPRRAGRPSRRADGCDQPGSVAPTTQGWRRLRGAGLLAEERGRRAGLLPGRCRANSGTCSDRTRR